MFSKMMKWFSVVALLLALFWRPSTSFQVMLGILICVSALLVVTQAVRAGKYIWALGFAAMAVLFNPVVPVGLSRSSFLWLDAICIVTFLLSLVALRTRPVLSIPGIIQPHRRIESL